MASARRTKRTLYIVTALYVAVGFVLSIGAAVAGDRLSTFLGFLIISGALAVAALFNAIFRVSARVQELAEKLDGVHEGLNGTGQPARTDQPDDTPSASSPIQMLDLANIGLGDPGMLAAATLDRATFPRLVTTMDEEPPAEGAGPGAGFFDDVAAIAPHLRAVGPADDTGDGDGAERVTTRPEHHRFRKAGPARDPEDVAVRPKDMLGAWRKAVHEGDLPACREILAALMDTADRETVAALSDVLSALADRKERELRASFSSCLARHDYAAALAVGDEILSLLPDRPVAADFERVRPLLLQRAEANAAAPVAAVSKELTVPPSRSHEPLGYPLVRTVMSRAGGTSS